MSIERRLRREQSRQQAKQIKGTFGAKGFGGELTAFGAFYKDLDNDGFSVFLSKHELPKDLWDIIETTFINRIGQQYKDTVELNYKAWKELDLPAETWEYQRQKINDESVEDLGELIKEWNVLAFGSGVRPLRGEIRKLSFGVEELRIALLIICLIYDLEQEGVIKPDNFNGMLYHYVSGDGLHIH